MVVRRGVHRRRMVAPALDASPEAPPGKAVAGDKDSQVSIDATAMRARIVIRSIVTISRYLSADVRLPLVTKREPHSDIDEQDRPGSLHDDDRRGSYNFHVHLNRWK